MDTREAAKGVIAFFDFSWWRLRTGNFFADLFNFSENLTSHTGIPHTNIHRSRMPLFDYFFTVGFLVRNSIQLYSHLRVQLYGLGYPRQSWPTPEVSLSSVYIYENVVPEGRVKVNPV